MSRRPGNRPLDPEYFTKGMEAQYSAAFQEARDHLSHNFLFDLNLLTLCAEDMKSCYSKCSKVFQEENQRNYTQFTNKLSKLKASQILPAESEIVKQRYLEHKSNDSDGIEEFGTFKDAANVEPEPFLKGKFKLPYHNYVYVIDMDNLSAKKGKQLTKTELLRAAETACRDSQHWYSDKDEEKVAFGKALRQMIVPPPEAENQASCTLQ